MVRTVEEIEAEAAEVETRRACAKRHRAGAVADLDVAKRACSQSAIEAAARNVRAAESALATLRDQLRALNDERHRAQAGRIEGDPARVLALIGVAAAAERLCGGAASVLDLRSALARLTGAWPTWREAAPKPPKARTPVPRSADPAGERLPPATAAAVEEFADARRASFSPKNVADALGCEPRSVAPIIGRLVREGRVTRLSIGIYIRARTTTAAIDVEESA